MKGSLAFIPHSSLIIPHSFAPSLTVGLPRRSDPVFKMEPSGKERRLKPRFGATLPCSVALAEAERDILFPGEKLDCRTRDLSESGVGVVAHSIYLGYTCILDEGRSLLVTVELPEGAVEMEATPAHYLRLDSDSGEASYLIGLRITSMSDGHRAPSRAQLLSASIPEQELTITGVASQVW